MNVDVAKELYARDYSDTIPYESFMGLLETGLRLAQQHPIADNLYVRRMFQLDELKAINIALDYNQQLMVRLLLEN